MKLSRHEPCRILIVDADTDTARTLEILCRGWGHETRTARSAEDAIRLFSAFAPDLALVDVNLPGMSGYDLARLVRTNSAQARTILIALAGLTSDANRIEAYRVGFNEYLAKPLHSEKLHEIVSELCSLAA